MKLPKKVILFGLKYIPKILLRLSGRCIILSKDFIQGKRFYMKPFLFKAAVVCNQVMWCALIPNFLDYF